MEGAAKAKQVGYVPGPDFIEDNKESLIDIEMNEDIELWLIQFPDDQLPDFDGQKTSLNLEGDGRMGSLTDKSGKVYHLVNYPAETADVTVFLSSPSGPKVAGKISRHVSLVHYPDPKELLALEKKAPSNSFKEFSTTSKSQKTPHSQSRSRSTHTSKRSSMSGITDVSKSSKRSNQSAQDSGRARSGVTISGSSEPSHRKKSKSKTNSEA